MSSEYDRLMSRDTKRQRENHIYKKTTLESSQANTSHAQTTGVTIKDVIGVAQDDELLHKIKEAVHINVSSGSTDKIKIQKVPKFMLRNEEFKKYFKPRDLSIGPIHAADSNLFKMELKLKLGARFIKTTGRTEYVLLQEIKRRIKEITECFDKEVIESYTVEELTWLLLLDGCAILGFMHSYVNRTLNELDVSSGQAALIQQDLFLLENQIPFIVLETLVGSPIGDWLSKDYSQEYFFIFLLKSNISNFPTDTKYLEKKIKDWKPVHVLDSLRYVITVDVSDGINCCLLIIFFLGILCSCGIVLIMMYLICLVCCSNVCNDSDRWRKKHSFRNVQELKTAGIVFEPSRSLKDISFRSQYFIRGKLKLLTLVVDNSTRRKLLNLVAFEMCLPNTGTEVPPHSYKWWVTSYINLLDLLIDNEHDVKDLRAAEILENCLSSDADVAQLINSTGSYCFAPPNDTYEDVKGDIEKHYKRRFAIWIAQLYYAHFSSPWTILALFAATVVLALTAVQTWYAINPK